MSEGDDFADLLRRVRAGDQQAATDLVRQYEPDLRLAVHVRLTDPGLRRVLDSVDICQSILAGFFLRVAAGQYELATPDQLLRLLAVMARNKIIDHVHKQRAARRDYRRDRAGNAEGLELADARPGPGSVVADRELLHEFRRRLTDDERRLADARAAGRSWDDIAAEAGGRANTLRVRLDRAVKRVLRELRVEE